MLLPKKIQSILPKGILLRLSLLNVFVVAAVIIISGLAVYNTACFLADSIGNLADERQQQFNATLFNYLLIFSVTVIVTASVLHFYLTRKIIQPIRHLTESTMKLKKGMYPEKVEVISGDEIGELTVQFNGLIQQLHANDQQRQKLVSDLSHELRTPLTNLKGYLYALNKGDIKGDSELFQSLYQEAARITEMIEQLELLKEWGYASSQEYKPNEKAAIERLLTQCAAMFQWRAEKQQIAISVDAEPKQLQIHAAGIQQAVSNLLENALDYYEGEGPVTVSGKIQDSVYRIAVIGPGKPIPEDKKDAIFERFYRLDASRSRQHGGSGLGLAIANEIVSYHGGVIGVESSGQQNTFWFTIPVAF